jgi:hypothetical protein
MTRQSPKTRRGKSQTAAQPQADAAAVVVVEAEEAAAVAVAVEVAVVEIVAAVGDEDGVSRREARDGDEHNTHARIANARLDREGRGKREMGG